MATKKIVPRADLEGGLGTASKRWASGSFGRIDATTISAKEYIVSSSVTQITTQQLSGSTQFGDTSDDTHQFTGSLLLET